MVLGILQPIRSFVSQTALQHQSTKLPSQHHEPGRAAAPCASRPPHCPVSTPAVGKPRSYPASTTAVRGPGAVARPPSSAEGSAPALEAPPTTASAATAARGAWASAGVEWSDSSSWDEAEVSRGSSPAVRPDAPSAELDGDEGAAAELLPRDDGDPRDIPAGGANAAAFYDMPAVPRDVLTEFEEKLEADVQTVVVTLTAILGVIIFWRGVWSLLDHFVGDSVFGDICCALVGLCIVLYIRLSGMKIAAFWPPS